MDVKQVASLSTSLGSFAIGDYFTQILTVTDPLTYWLQNVAFVVSIAAGIVTIYYTCKKHLNGKNTAK